MNQPIRGDQVRGHLETILLSILDRQPSHGFQLVRALEEQGCGLLKLREGTIYPVLYRLEKAGLVKARWEETEPGRKGPPRRVYELTRQGRRQLQQGRQAWSQFVSVVGTLVQGATA